MARTMTSLWCHVNTMTAPITKALVKDTIVLTASNRDALVHSSGNTHDTTATASACQMTSAQAPVSRARDFAPFRRRTCDPRATRATARNFALDTARLVTPATGVQGEKE